MARLCHRGNGTGNPRQHRDFCRLCGRAWIFRPSCSRVSTDWTALSWLLAGQIPIGIMDIRIRALRRSEEHTSELQSLMRISYAVFCLQKKTENHDMTTKNNTERSREHTTSV